MQSNNNSVDNIRTLQNYLREIHYADGSIPLVIPSGVYNSQTSNAVRAFQQQNGLVPTGRVDYSSWQAIYKAYQAALETNAPPRRLAAFPNKKDYVMRRGEYSDAVAIVQFILRALANIYDSIKGEEPDGVYNDSTMEDIRNFQKAHQLPITGETDKRTWNQLADAYNRLSEIEN